MRPSLLRQLQAKSPSSSKHAAVVSAACLVGLQVFFGILTDYVQLGREPKFSLTSCVAISELLKLTISLALFYVECRKRAANRLGPASRRGSATYSSLEGSSRRSQDRSSGEWTSESTFFQDTLRDSDKEGKHAQALSLKIFWDYIRGELSADLRYGFARLALLNAVISNSVCPDGLDAA
jgi:hypothetical protein